VERELLVRRRMHEARADEAHHGRAGPSRDARVIAIEHLVELTAAERDDADQHRRGERARDVAPAASDRFVVSRAHVAEPHWKTVRGESES
jgi:hypothetical protein